MNKTYILSKILCGPKSGEQQQTTQVTRYSNKLEYSCWVLCIFWYEEDARYIVKQVS